LKLIHFLILYQIIIFIFYSFPLDYYFNGNYVDTVYDFWYNPIVCVVNTNTFCTTHTFTPTESGFYYCTANITNDQNGLPFNCFSNQNAVSNAIYITVCNLAVSDFDISGLKYYPNPVKNNLSLSAKTIINNVEISSVLGQIVLSKKVNDLQTEINLSELTNGVYFVKVTSDGKDKTVKIVKE
jgi:hypothetical protein